MELSFSLSCCGRRLERLPYCYSSISSPCTENLTHRVRTSEQPSGYHISKKRLRVEPHARHRHLTERANEKGPTPFSNIPLPSQNSNVLVKPKSVSFSINSEAVPFSNPCQSYTSSAARSLAPTNPQLNCDPIYYLHVKKRANQTEMDPKIRSIPPFMRSLPS